MNGVLQLLLIFSGVLGAAFGLVIAGAIAARSSATMRKCYVVGLPLAVVLFLFADLAGVAGFLARVLGIHAVTGMLAGWLALCLAIGLLVGLGISPLRPNNKEQGRD